MDSESATTAVCNLSIAQQQTVRDTLVSILGSTYFSRSRRYPALLEFLVLSTLDGNAGALKERTVGVEVFGRPQAYDPSTDPVVRVATGEVRKRLALYFSEHPDAPVRIELPVGHYTAEFHFRPDSTADIVPQQPNPTPRMEPAISAPDPSVSIAARPRTKLAWAGGLVIAALLLAGGIGYSRYTRQAASSDFWAPVFQDKVPALVVVGEFSAGLRAPSSPTPPAPAGVVSSAAGDGTSMANAFTAGQVCNAFQRYSRPCTMVSADHVDLPGLQNKTVVLIGRDNDWTQRLLTRLPYRFEYDAVIGDSPNSEHIQDQSGDPNHTAWRVNPTPPTDTDYAIVGRFHSDITDGTAVVAAGLTPNGTLGAEQFISSSDEMKQLIAQAPKNWNGFNFEAVLQMDVIQNTPGHVKLVRAKFW